MYCPRCGNQPATDRMRFCPSCGFKLDGVIDLLARDGVPTNPLPVPQISEPSPKKKGLRRGAKIIFASIVMFVPIFAFSVAENEPGPLVIPATIFIAGIFWMLYYKLFGEEHKPAPAPPQVILPPSPPPAYLPQPQSVPVYRPPVEPPKEQSVVEHTTRSLGQQ